MVLSLWLMKSVICKLMSSLHSSYPYFLYDKNLLLIYCRIGARHDGNAKDGETCAPHEGFIMTSGLMLSEKGFEWSKCTINAFYKFIKYVSYVWYTFVIIKS